MTNPTTTDRPNITFCCRIIGSTHDSDQFIEAIDRRSAATEFARQRFDLLRRSGVDQPDPITFFVNGCAFEGHADGRLVEGF